MELTVCSCHITYVSQSECTVHICLKVKELLARKWPDIWSLSDCNWTRIQNHGVCKRTLNHLAKLTEGLSCLVITYPYVGDDCMFLLCHVRSSEWIHTLYLPECQRTLARNKTQYLKFMWLQLSSNPEPFGLERNTEPFGLTGKIIGLCCEYLSVRCIWLCILVMSRTHFRVNPHSIFAWMSRNSFLKTGAISEV